MAFKINEFKNALPYGGARANMFEVRIPEPQSGLGIRGHGDKTINAMRLNTKATTIPPSTIEPVEVPFYGRTFRLPGGRTFDDWETTITNDEDFRVRDWMEQWSDQINSHTTNLSTNLASRTGDYRYTVDAEVIQFGKNGAPIRRYVMVDAWPHTIGEISLDWSENGSIEEFPVTWAFSWWESVALEATSKQNLLTTEMKPIDGSTFRR